MAGRKIFAYIAFIINFIGLAASASCLLAWVVGAFEVARTFQFGVSILAQIAALVAIATYIVQLGERDCAVIPHDRRRRIHSWSQHAAQLASASMECLRGEDEESMLSPSTPAADHSEKGYGRSVNLTEIELLQDLGLTAIERFEQEVQDGQPAFVGRYHQNTATIRRRPTLCDTVDSDAELSTMV